MTEPELAKSPGIAERIDDAIFLLEKTFVTVAALVMTATVTLDIIFRAFASPDSKIAEKLGKILGIFGSPPSESTMKALEDWGSPAILILLCFAAGWGVYAAGERRLGKRGTFGRGVISGLVAVMLCYALIQFIMRVPSKWVCMVVIAGGVLGYLFYASRRRAWTAAAITAALGVPLCWGCMYLSQDYIWSQELSLILLAWIAFVGGSMATRTHKHITVDALAKVIPKAVAPWVRALGLLVTTMFCAYLSILAYDAVFGPKGALAQGEVRPSTGIPGWTITFGIFIAFAMTTARFGGHTIGAFLKREMPDRSLTH